jgi:hypothetical protein
VGTAGAPPQVTVQVPSSQAETEQPVAGQVTVQLAAPLHSTSQASAFPHATEQTSPGTQATPQLASSSHVALQGEPS